MTPTHLNGEEFIPGLVGISQSHKEPLHFATPSFSRNPSQVEVSAGSQEFNHFGEGSRLDELAYSQGGIYPSMNHQMFLTNYNVGHQTTCYPSFPGHIEDLYSHVPNIPPSFDCSILDQVHTPHSNNYEIQNDSTDHVDFQKVSSFEVPPYHQAGRVEYTDPSFLDGVERQDPNLTGQAISPEQSFWHTTETGRGLHTQENGILVPAVPTFHESHISTASQMPYRDEWSTIRLDYSEFGPSRPHKSSIWGEVILKDHSVSDVGCSLPLNKSPRGEDYQCTSNLKEAGSVQYTPNEEIEVSKNGSPSKKKLKHVLGVKEDTLKGTDNCPTYRARKMISTRMHPDLDCSESPVQIPNQGISGTPTRPRVDTRKNGKATTCFLRDVGRKYIETIPGLQSEIHDYFRNLSISLRTSCHPVSYIFENIHVCLHSVQEGFVRLFLAALRILESPSGNADKIAVLLNRGWEFIKQNIFQEWWHIDFETSLRIVPERKWENCMIYDPPRALGYFAAVHAGPYVSNKVTLHFLIEWARTSKTTRITKDRFIHFEAFYGYTGVMLKSSNERERIIQRIFKDTNFCENLSSDYDNITLWEGKATWRPYHAVLQNSWELRHFFSSNIYEDIYSFFHKLRRTLLGRFSQNNVPGKLSNQAYETNDKNIHCDEPYPGSLKRKTNLKIQDNPHSVLPPLVSKNLEKKRGRYCVESPQHMIVNAIDNAEHKALVMFLRKVENTFVHGKEFDVHDTLIKSWIFFKSFFSKWEDMDMTIGKDMSAFGPNIYSKPHHHEVWNRHVSVFQIFTGEHRTDGFIEKVVRDLYILWRKHI